MQLNISNIKTQKTRFLSRQRIPDAVGTRQCRVPTGIGCVGCINILAYWQNLHDMLPLIEIRRRHCRVPTILFCVGRRQYLSPYNIILGRDTALPSPPYYC